MSSVLAGRMAAPPCTTWRSAWGTTCASSAAAAAATRCPLRRPLILCTLQVLGLEAQPAAPHDQGSSHGLSRIIRLAYFEHPSYVPLLRSSYKLWREAEAESGQVRRRAAAVELWGRLL